MEAAMAPQQPISAKIVGNAFVQQYYHILHHSPGLVYRFYQDISKLGRPEDDGSMSLTTTMHGINVKICSLKYDELKAEIKSVDAQESFNGGVEVLVTGFLMVEDNTVREFAQAFFLAPQEKGYFVLNDMFRYVDKVTVSPPVVNEVVVPPVAAEPVPAPTVQVNQVFEQSPATADEAIGDEAITGEVYNPPESGDVPAVEEEEEEEVTVAEVVDEVQGDSRVTVESSAKIEEMPKKSYASMVIDLKESVGSFSAPVAAPQKVSPKRVEIARPDVVPASNRTISTAESVDNGANQEAEGYSVYIGGLPMNASTSMLEEVFKKFGMIKIDGIQVRFNNLRDFCFGFVEYEDASSVQKAIEASPVIVGGRHVDVEEKRSTYSRGSNRRTFQSGRGGGFRSEGGRGGRGNYVGGGGNGRDGYNNRSGRDDFNWRSEYVNRGGNRGGGPPSSNRDDGYHQKPESFNNSSGNSNINGGGHMNRNGNSKGVGMPNRSNGKPVRVSATA